MTVLPAVDTFVPVNSVRKVGSVFEIEVLTRYSHAVHQHVPSLTLRFVGANLVNTTVSCM